MFAGLLRQLRGLAAPVASTRQSGALPYRIVDGKVVFLLITSRKTGRWIYPKGSVSTGLMPWDSAAKEALEEAGVIGTISDEPIGFYSNVDKGLRVEVVLYPLLVETQLDTWDEQDQRLRHWVLLDEAQRLLSDRHLAALTAKLHQQVSAAR